MENMPLSANQRFLLTEKDNNKIIKGGNVHVFLSPYKDDKPMRQMYLGEALVGDVIPAPPSGTEGMRWVLICEAESPAVVGDVDLASKSRAYAAYIEDSVFNLGREFGLSRKHVLLPSFWDTVISRYREWEEERAETVRNRVEENRRMEEETASRIRHTLGGSLMYEISSMKRSGEELYDALAFLCKRRNISIASPAAIRKAGEGRMSIENIARMSGFICREVDLTDNWKKEMYQPLLGTLTLEDGEEHYVVCFRRLGRLCLFDPLKRSIRHMSRSEEKGFGARAWEILRPFKSEEVDLKSVLSYCKDEVSYMDLAIWLIAMYLVTQAGLGLSNLSRIIYDRAIPLSDASLAYAMGGIFLFVMIANFLFSMANNLTLARITTRITYALQGAVYDRTFHMPENYFRNQEKAAIAYRIYHLSEMYVSVLRNGGQIIIQTLFSLFYVARMFRYSNQLSLIGLAIAGMQIALTAVQSVLARRLSMKRIGMLTDVRSFLYQTFSGISTIRSGGAEGHTLHRYMEKETNLGRVRRKNDDLLRTISQLMAFLNGAGLILFYNTMGRGMGISQGTFMAFLTANSLFSGAVLQVTADMVSLIAMLPVLKDSAGVLKEIPEKPGRGQTLKTFHGDIVFSHVSYGYGKGNDKILKDISLHIRPGEYIGIAGPSGCGKSTLIRLLLGFARPNTGQVYYDGVPINRLDMTMLRRRIGCVLQDGNLITGTILQNIQIVNPEATEEDVWSALEKAGIKEEIEAMPLGLLTPVSEDGQTLSGGQKQRIMIARAIVGNPKFLIFDEATSALDNVTQDKIMQSLDGLSATRVAVAHRLSTLRGCDRILVMDQGRIVEQGSYTKLMEGKGKFYEMVQVQHAV